jgi:hypothetical protein
MIANLNTGTVIWALVITAIFVYLTITGRLPRRITEADRLREMERTVRYLQDEDIRKGQMIAELREENSVLKEKVRFLEAQMRPFGSFPPPPVETRKTA